MKKRIFGIETEYGLLVKDNNDNDFRLDPMEIANKIKVSRNTVPVILAELKGEGKIRIRPVGKAKLHYWKK